MDTKKANRVSVITMILNIVLAAIKFAAGIFAHSQALISDAVHSVSDVFSTVMVMIGINMSAKASDDAHPYGHERIESVFSIILSVSLFLTAVGICRSSVGQIANRDTIKIPGIAAVIAAAVSIAVKEWMYHYTRRAADEISSPALLADAWHHRSDALSSVGALIGAGGAYLGFTILEPVASIVISFMILKAAYDIFMEAVNDLIDRSCDSEEEEKLRKVILETEGVKSIDLLRTRRFGSKIYVDVEISEDGSLSLYNAHLIAEEVHRRVETAFKNVKHCMVHVNPT